MAGIGYCQSHKTKWHKNPISGHEWPEYIDIQQWEAYGGSFLRTYHKTEAGAIKEVAAREAFAKKFPHTVIRPSIALSIA